MNISNMKHIFISFSLALFVACSGNNDGSENENTNNNDSLEITTEESALETEDKEMQELIEAQKTKEPEETGPPFCECVKKQEALNNKMMEAETDEEIKAVQKEMSALVNGECKKILSANIVSKDQQAEHQRKVKACLGK
ncbi:hypothetical protein FLAV_01024 [Flavobacteriales bacterium]|nr:hypothetical protein [Flavobacteriales bacterium]GIK68804.1 MAG: hypothetical protein BroJett020_00990 [Bacteroidota bacterium]CAG0967085.1 hypothetical protein FLAV_01024 [Flavobacteriales bacterium]